ASGTWDGKVYDCCQRLFCPTVKDSGGQFRRSPDAGERMRMPNLEGTPRFLVCCDWGLAPGGRAIYVGDAQARTLGPGGPTPFCNANGDPWTLSAVLELGRRLRDQGPVLLAFDMPLGIPASYLDAARAVPRWS